MSTTDDTAMLRFPKLSDSNWGTWAVLAEAQLTRKGLWTDIVEILIDMYDADGNARTQDAIDKDAETKKKKRSVVKMAEARAELILLVEPGQLPHMRSKDPLAIWEDLKIVHRARGFAATLSIRRRFLTMKMKRGQKMSSWIGEVKAQAFEMEEAGVEATETDTILALTMGLPATYDGLIQQLDAIPAAELTLDYVITRLLSDEVRQTSRSTPATTYAATATVTDAAMAASHKIPTPIADVVCFFCQKKGHYRDTCDEKKDWDAFRAKKETVAVVADDDDAAWMVEDMSLDSDAEVTCTVVDD